MSIPVKILLVLLVVAGAVFIAQPRDVVHTEQNELLQSHINSFMESQVGADDIGRDHYYCSNFFYGYDSRYAYAWVYCSGFVIEKGGVLKQGTAFSIPTRLEYRQPNFQVIGYKQPGDGDLYNPTLRKLFPPEIYEKGSLPDAQVLELARDVERRAKANARY